MTALDSPARPAGTQEVTVARYTRAHPEAQVQPDLVIAEGALSLQVDGTPYTLLRTPGNDRELVVGFLFTEGLIGRLDEVLLLSECPDAQDVIKVKTARAGDDKARRTLVITSSCGLCGREDLDGLIASLGRIEAKRRISQEALCQVPAAVRPLQPLFCATGGAHAMALIGPDGHVQCVREDVGRHNAMDKLIGHALMQRISLEDMVVFLSGRTSLEMIIKVARARIPIIAAVGAPTAAAVAAADRLGITLCGFLRDDRVSVYTHGWRIAQA